jgi:hypothetical protein
MPSLKIKTIRSIIYLIKVLQFIHIDNDEVSIAANR